MNGSVVVDASLAFKWLVEEEYSGEAVALSMTWASQGIRTAAPHFMPVEVTNALHRRVVRNELSVGEAAELIGTLMASGIQLHSSVNVYARALELASDLRQRAVYDAHYLALADALDCEMWTADEKFFKAASAVAGNVRWIGEFRTSTTTGGDSQP